MLDILDIMIYHFLLVSTSSKRGDVSWRKDLQKLLMKHLLQYAQKTTNLVEQIIIIILYF